MVQNSQLVEDTVVKDLKIQLDLKAVSYKCFMLEPLVIHTMVETFADRSFVEPTGVGRTFKVAVAVVRTFVEAVTGDEELSKVTAIPFLA